MRTALLIVALILFVVSAGLYLLVTEAPNNRFAGFFLALGAAFFTASVAVGAF